MFSAISVSREEHDTVQRQEVFNESTSSGFTQRNPIEDHNIPREGIDYEAGETSNFASLLLPQVFVSMYLGRGLPRGINMFFEKLIR